MARSCRVSNSIRFGKTPGCPAATSKNQAAVILGFPIGVYDPAMNTDADTRPTIPSVAELPVVLRTTMDQIEFTIDYVAQLLDATPRDRWFEIPDGLPTNVAWQVGHLAVAQYGLLLFRIRGRAEADLELIPGKFRKAYGKATTPNADPSRQPSPDDLVARLDQVWSTAKKELPPADLESLLDPVEMPFAAYPNKLGCLMFAPLHMQIHAGQIGLVRRGLGLEPVR